MNRDQIEGTWKQVAGKAKELRGRLAGDSLAVVQARRDRFAGKIQERRGNATQESMRQLREFMYRNRDWYASDR